MENILIETDGYQFDGLAAGPHDGELVLMLHGFPQTSFSYRHQIEDFGAEGFRAVAFDQRGYSPSARPLQVSDYAVSHLVEDVIKVASTLGYDRFHLVGHDWGAAVGWAVAAHHSSKLKSYTALSVPHTDAFSEAMRSPESSQSEKSQYIKMFVQKDSEDLLLQDDSRLLRDIYIGISKEDVEVYLKSLGSKEALGSALNWYRANFDGQLSSLGKVQVPTLYVWGAKDIALGSYAAHATQKYVDAQNYKFVPIDDAGHWLLESHSQLISKSILDHIRRL